MPKNNLVPRRWFTLMTMFALGGCVFSTPFRTVGNPPTSSDAAPETVVVAVTHAVLGDDSEANDTFWRYVWIVQDTLPTRPGLVGYGLRREILGGQAWTVTVWADEQSLKDFVSSDAHRGAMRSGMSALKEARFARFEAPRDQVPISWERALAELEKQNGTYGS